MPTGGTPNDGGRSERGLRIGTWIRESDLAWFLSSFSFSSDVRLLNARVQPVDLGTIDALLLTGGADVGAEFLKQPVPDPSLIREPNARRDAWEFDAIEAVFPSGRPILAICRGHQVLNVALGGTLRLDISGHNLQDQRDHEVQPLRYANGVPDSRVFPRVNSSHHQAVESLGAGLEAEGWCEIDEVVEQMRHREHPWCVGVQYHPERGQIYAPLFRSLVEAVERH